MRISRQTLGIAGAIVLALGVFTPIVRLPLVGTVNYFAHGDGDGAIVLVLAAGATVLLLMEKYRLVLIPAGLSLGLIAYTFIDLQTRLHNAREALDGIGRPFGGLGSLAVQAVQLQWGWVVMLVGVAFLGAAALMPEEEASQTPAEPAPAPAANPDGPTTGGGE